MKQRSGIIEEDRDIRDIRAGLMACEKAVKETEQRVREQHDYRFVLQYFCASRELHRTLVANVNYLANEVEQLRASVDHSDESIKLMEQQLLELEVSAFRHANEREESKYEILIWLFAVYLQYFFMFSLVGGGGG